MKADRKSCPLQNSIINCIYCIKANKQPPANKSLSIFVILHQFVFYFNKFNFHFIQILYNFSFCCYTVFCGHKLQLIFSIPINFICSFCYFLQHVFSYSTRFHHVSNCAIILRLFV